MAREFEGRTLFFADVHSNLEAFRAVLEDAGKPGVGFEHAVFLGDVIGYCANPNECISMLRDLKKDVESSGGSFAAIAGNHDDCLLMPTEEAFRKRLEWFNELAQASMLWTRERVTQANKEWLRSVLNEPSHAAGFRRFFATDLFYACHGGPGDLYDAYAGFEYDPKAVLEAIEQKILFVAHTHEAAVLTFDGKAFVNIPAVGQPRDNNPETGYVLFDAGAACVSVAGESSESDLLEAIQVRRVKYEVEEAARKIIQAGLPKALAERLFAGT